MAQVGDASLNRHRLVVTKGVVGFVFIVASLLLLYLDFSNIAALGLFGAWLVSLPIFLLMFLSCALLLSVRVRRSVESWFIFAIATSLPWSVILPVYYQILAAVLFGIVILSLFLWYRRKHGRQTSRGTTSTDS